MIAQLTSPTDENESRDRSVATVSQQQLSPANARRTGNGRVTGFAVAHIVWIIPLGDGKPIETIAELAGLARELHVASLIPGFGWHTTC